MSSKILRLIGVLFAVAGAVLAILNLKKVADLGTLWVAAPLLLIAIVLAAMSRKRE